MTTLSESRTNQLWAALAGMFGGERLARAFGKSPPREWVEMVGRLTDYDLQRGMRRLMASGSAQIPTAPQFRKFCQEVRNDDLDAPQAEDLPRLPSHLMAQDKWEVASNRHLMQHLLTRLGRNSKAFRPVVADRDGSKPQQACTAILVAWKKRWAELMRQSQDANGEVDAKDQRELWDSHMQSAEQEIVDSGIVRTAA